MIQINRFLTSSDYIDKDNKKISIVIAIHLYLTAIKNMLSSTISPAFSIGNVLNAFSLILLAICYLFLVFKTNFLKRIPAFVYLLVAIIFLFFGVSFLFDHNLFISNYDNYFYVKRQSTLFLVYSLPLFLCCSALRKTDDLFFYLRKFAPIGLIFSVIGFAFYFAFKTNNVQYSMSFGNQVMMPCIVYIFSAIINKKKTDILYSILLVAIIVLVGSRGPLVCIGLAFFYYIFRFEKKTSAIRVLVGAIIIALVLVLIVYFKEIVEAMYNVLLKLGFNSRSLETISKRGILYDSGRSLYHETLINAINEHPFIGLGAFGGEVTVGLSHSIYLDIFANFGYFFGAMIILFILFIMYYFLSISDKKNVHYVCLMLALMILPRGFFDDTFWAAKELWMLFGLFFGIALKKTSLVKDAKQQ